MHNGNVGIVNADEAIGVVELKFLGACQACPITTFTFQHIIEKTLKEQMPRVSDIIDVDNPVGEL